MSCEKLCQNCWHVESEHDGITRRCHDSRCNCAAFLPPFLPTRYGDDVREAIDAAVKMERARWEETTVADVRKAVDEAMKAERERYIDIVAEVMGRLSDVVDEGGGEVSVITDDEGNVQTEHVDESDAEWMHDGAVMCLSALRFGVTP